MSKSKSSPPPSPILPYKPGEMIYACMPSYGQGNKQAHRQFWARSVYPDSPYAGMDSRFDDYGGSLLSDCFNYHWRQALNMRLEGQNVTRFVMLHDDIAPENGWMGALLEELDRHPNADVLSVVVPIKDARGLTSTAIDDPADPWAVYRRITMKEVEGLPVTFDAYDCAKAGLCGSIKTYDDKTHSFFPYTPLLPNTGCWVARMDRPWVYGFDGFHINSRVAFQPEGSSIQESIPVRDYRPGMRGMFVNQVMSEDWNFGRQLHLLGANVKCTRKIKVYHFGEAPFNNQDFGWGVWANDENLRDKWEGDPYADVAGWMRPVEGRALEVIAEGRTVMEIGAYAGKSTLWLARKAKRVFAVDTFDGRGTPEPRDTYNEFKENLRKYNVPFDRVRAIHADTSDRSSHGTIASFVKDGSLESDGHVDVVFIDGAHDAKSIRNDVDLALRVLSPDGVIAFHDYQDPERPHNAPPGVVCQKFSAVRDTVDAMLEGVWEKVGRVRTVIVIKRKGVK